MAAVFPKRRSTRLPGYDYSQNGSYFITVCTYQHQCIFGEIHDGEMKLNDVGQTVHDIWKSLPNHHDIELDACQIMPNHIHFIINILDSGRSRPTPTLGLIIGLFKSECTKQISSVGARRDSPVKNGQIWARRDSPVKNGPIWARRDSPVKNNPKKFIPSPTPRSFSANTLDYFSQYLPIPRQTTLLVFFQ